MILHLQMRRASTVHLHTYRKRQTQAASLGCIVTKSLNIRFRQAPHVDAPAQAAHTPCVIMCCPYKYIQQQTSLLYVCKKLQL